ncbi:MAG: hydrolase or metal-binding protein [Rhodocyclaceae bacterium]
MIKGLAITPPVIGRIAIGHMVERNGKRLPEKDDHFTLTTQVQGRDGWMLHPLHTQLAESAGGKLRAIPVKLLFNAPDLNLRADYSLFDRSNGRLMCVGNGDAAQRVTEEGVKEVPCPGPENCAWGGNSGCKLYGRLNVQVEGQDDELGSFVFRTTGYNSIRTLTARLHYFQAISGGYAKHLPLLLRLRAKSTTLSRGTPIYYADLSLREGHSLTETVTQAREEAQRQHEAGVQTEWLENVARQVLANGRFEETEEEGMDVVEEFLPDTA